MEFGKNPTDILMTIESKVAEYIELRSKLEELENQKKRVVAEILELIPKGTNTIQLPHCRVKRASLLSIKTSLENAQRLGAIKIKEVVDRDKIKQLYESGQNPPDVTEVHFIQVYSTLSKDTNNPIEKFEA
jgi:hypothetical protein